MGAIFPMAPLKVRLGFLQKREKEARRAATAIRPKLSIGRQTGLEGAPMSSLEAVDGGRRS
jgi:hypothetical protein